MNIFVYLWNKYFVKPKTIEIIVQRLTKPNEKPKTKVEKVECKVCHKKKTLSNKYFSINKNNQTGFNSTCKNCVNKKYRALRYAKPTSKIKNRVERQCGVCNIKFYPYKSEIDAGSGFYCNKKCMAKGMSILKSGIKQNSYESLSH